MDRVSHPPEPTPTFGPKVGRRWRIAQIAPPGIEVPPEGYGASELVVSNLTEELVRRGHEVTLFAHPGSHTAAEHRWFPEVYEFPDADQREIAHVSRALDLAGRFDIIHNHCIFPGPSLVRHASVPSLTTLHYLRPLIFAFADESYAAISSSQARLLPGLNIVGVAYNGIDCQAFPVVEEKSDYLLWIGRIDPKKGPDLAIEVARRVGMPLLLAASYPTRDNRAYFEERVKSGLGGNIEYVGEVKGKQKVEIISRAHAVLMPATWEEPFGLVATEALAAGTPVIATRRGALPEIIVHGVAGYIVDDVDQMAEAVEHLEAIDPWAGRRIVEERFSAAAMAEAYEAIYLRLLLPHQVLGATERAS